MLIRSMCNIAVNMSGNQFFFVANTFGAMKISLRDRASDFFQDWRAEVTHGAKNGVSFSEMMGPSISN